ncbi:MAG TPA: substrate-binding domain-containing protein, partial [Mycobacteriales bacterium]|nr:substrate-binding domain-containing protein [Mycobacteriales bacterium]
GYRRALKRAGIPVDSSLIVRAAGFRRPHGAEAMRTLLDRPDPPDAVFCYNDPLALGAMRVALTRGLRVPEDIAIAGFDDSEDGLYSTPSLTTISQNKPQIAEYAVELLMARLKDGAGPPITRNARWELKVRESTTGRTP